MSSEVGTRRRDSGKGRAARRVSRLHMERVGAQGHACCSWVNRLPCVNRKQEGEGGRKEKEKKKKKGKEERGKRKGGVSGIRGACHDPGVTLTRSDTPEKRGEQGKVFTMIDFGVETEIGFGC